MSVGLEYISVNVESEASFYSDYLPFVADGGLFLKTTSLLFVGDVVIVEFRTGDANPAYLGLAEVAWTGPADDTGASKVALEFGAFADGHRFERTQPFSYHLNESVYGEPERPAMAA